MTLVKAVLGLIANYLMSIYPVPLTVIKELERLRSVFFRGADLDDRRMHWVSWDKILAPKEVGGLGIGSLYAFNRALLLRWKWRFFHNPNLLWVRVVKRIYGLGEISNPLIPRSHFKGPWNGIKRIVDNLKDRGFDFHNLAPIRIGDGAYTSFWHDKWQGNNPLLIPFHRIFSLDLNRAANVKDRFLIGWNPGDLRRMPRGGIEETQWISFLEVVQGVQLCHIPNRLGWSLDSSDSFSVASVRHALDSGLVPSGDMGTRWNNWVPIKINILIWRIQLFSIPTRERFSVRGVMVPSIMCPICMVAVETIDHILQGAMS